MNKSNEEIKPAKKIKNKKILKSFPPKKKTVNSRTVMIFMAGTNLESNNGLASSDLNGIIPEQIDLNTTKVLLYTGGTKRWHNFVSSSEDAIYELTSEGFVKAKSFNKSNLGYDTALANFLNYSYEYSKTWNKIHEK